MDEAERERIRLDSKISAREKWIEILERVRADLNMQIVNAKQGLTELLNERQRRDFEEQVEMKDE